MTAGYIIVFAPDMDQPANYFWDGEAQVGMGATGTPDEAKFFSNKVLARLELGKVQQIYSNQQAAIVASNLVITPSFDSHPDVTAPVDPAPSTPGTPNP